MQWLRKLLLHEPRGQPALCAVLLPPPVTPGADFGVVVLEQDGFTPMSGSNTMCAVAGAVEAGLVTPDCETLDVTVDTAVGTVRARADVVDGRVTAVTVANVPSFVVGLDVPIDVPGWAPCPSTSCSAASSSCRRRRPTAASTWIPPAAATSSGSTPW